MSLQLKEARIQAGYSIEEVAKKLNIRKQYLQAIEEEDYHILPGQVYIDGYKKLYAKYLGVSLEAAPVREEEQRFFHNKSVYKEKFGKYPVAISIVMLILIITIYQLISDSNLSSSNVSEIDNSNYNNDVNYANERDE